MPNEVPNVQPKIAAPFRLAVLGEAPGRDEEAVGVPFVGASGKLLHSLIGQAGFSLRQCYYGNICRVRPTGNNIENFSWHGPELTSGVEQLTADLAAFKPNCILLLGQTALTAFRADRESISNFRGSLFLSDGAIPGYKCIASLHPAACLRQWDSVPFLKFDLAKARKQSDFPDLRLPERIAILEPSLDQALTYLARLKAERSLVSFDVEGWCDNVGVTMISFATNPHSGIVIPFYIDAEHYWNEDDEVLIWSAIAGVLGDASIPKVCQNALYECFILAWNHKIVVRGIADDTMYAHWELFPNSRRI